MGSAMKAATVSAPSRRDHVLDLGNQAIGERVLALARFAVAEIMRAGRVQDAFDRQVESLVIDRDARQAAGGVREAVIGAEPRDEFLLLGLAAQVVVVADKLEIRVVGVRAAHAKKHFRHVGRASFVVKKLQHAFGKPDDRLVGGAAEDVVIGEVLDGLLGRIGHLGPAVSDVDAPESGAAIDNVFALLVLDAHAATVGKYHRPLLEVIGDRGVGVEQALAVDVLERKISGSIFHGAAPDCMLAEQ